jgi:putative membrane protein
MCEDDAVQSFFVRVFVSGVGIWIAAAIVPGVELGEAPFTDQALTVLVVALIFGAVNAVLGPMLRLLTFPLFVLTLGLFSLVVNALLLWFTGWLAQQVDLAFSVAGFWAAFLGALVVTLITVVIGAMTRK